MRMNPRRSGSLREIALLFLKLGTIAFGGPAAHIAMMEDEVVIRRRWLSKEKFLDLLGAANLIPGPSSTELAIYIGYLQAGWIGLLLAGVCFILPAALVVTALAWAYVQFGSLPQAVGILYGVKPVIIAVILSVVEFGTRCRKNKVPRNGRSCCLIAEFPGGKPVNSCLRGWQHYRPKPMDCWVEEEREPDPHLSFTRASRPSLGLRGTIGRGEYVRYAFLVRVMADFSDFFENRLGGLR